ncbi:Upstream activation factor subunit UAF30 [Toxocara canis]|uniref:Upstream activation factor subunit UAF30 n=1 Tax=Toxocara canis TaxID=6265 RepID=A0A0B2URT7_TOXCA|nr:Upstream activation factor subunit UAF30 [Toxocara canis]
MLRVAQMSDSDESPRLPVDEDVLRRAIVAQIERFGMDKLTSRLIRENLKKEFDADFTPFKAQIDKIAMEIMQSKNEKETKKENESSESSDSESDDGVVFTDSAPKKKQKSSRKRSASGSDSELLEVGQKKRRAAPAAKKGAPKKKRTPAEGGAKRKTAYSVCCALTDDLAAIVGKQYMRRSEVVKAMWAYFRTNNLMDPKDKRYVLADEPLMKLFKKRRFLAFGMMKDLVPHIIEAKFLNDTDRAALEKYEAEEDARRAQEEAKHSDEHKNGHNGAGSSKQEENSGEEEKSDNDAEDVETDSD